MTMFLITMNMPTRGARPDNPHRETYGGNDREAKPTHQVHGEHPAKDLGEFLKACSESEFIIVKEHHLVNGQHSYRSELMLNTMMIGKATIWEEGRRWGGAVNAG